MSTSKGELLSSILYPEKMLFKYDEELPIVVLLLLAYAFVCFIISIVFQVGMLPPVSLKHGLKMLSKLFGAIFQ
jgi:MFS-type transporter involved in bile tolerance (Atg22 family)